MKPTQKDNPKGKRYTEAERKKILNHVEHVNKTRGRGGIASASKKFNVTALTISNWIRSAHPFSSSLGGTHGKSNPAEILRRLAGVHEEITKRERELARLRKEFENLRKSI